MFILWQHARAEHIPGLIQQYAVFIYNGNIVGRSYILITYASTLAIFHGQYYSDVTWVPSRLKSPAYHLFVQELGLANSKEIIKAPQNWFCGRNQSVMGRTDNTEIFSSRDVFITRGAQINVFLTYFKQHFNTTKHTLTHCVLKCCWTMPNCSNVFFKCVKRLFVGIFRVL